MDKKSHLKEFIKYTSLNVLGMMGLSCYILADTFFISKALGTNGLTALNLAIPIYSFVHGFGLMIGMGGAINYSIHKNKGESNMSDKIFSNALLLTAIFGTSFLLLGFFSTNFIVKILGADAAVFEMTQTYLQVILMFAPIFMLNNLLLCFVRNDGAPQLAMMAMTLGSLSNIVLDYVFLFYFDMGILGAVLATAFAPLISLGLLSYHFVKGLNQFHFKRNLFSKRQFLKIISNGIPSLIIETSSGIVIIVFNIIILSLVGNVGVAAYGIVANISLVVIAIYTGIAQGIQPLVSREYGAMKYKDMTQTLKYTGLALAIISICLYGLIFYGAELIARVFNSNQDVVLQEIAVKGLKIYFLASLFAGLNIILSIYLTSTNTPRPAYMISILRGFILIIPMAYVFSFYFGIVGIWMAFPVTEMIVSAFGLNRFFKNQSQLEFDRA